MLQLGVRQWMDRGSWGPSCLLLIAAPVQMDNDSQTNWSVSSEHYTHTPQHCDFSLSKSADSTGRDRLPLRIQILGAGVMGRATLTGRGW